MTETTRRILSHVQRLSCSRSWHQNIVDGYRERERDFTKQTLRAEDLVPNASRRGRRKKRLTRAQALPPVRENQTDDKSSSSSDKSSSLSSSTQAPCGIPQHVNDQAQTNSRSQQQTVMGANVPAVPAPTVLPTATPKAQLRVTTPTKRAAEPTTLDVLPQAKHPRGEGSQMDFGSMTVAGVAMGGN